MAKTKGAKRKSAEAWTGADHSDRTAKRIASLQKKQRKKQLQQQESLDGSTDAKSKPSTKRHRLSPHVPSNTYKRTHLAHDNAEQIELSRLRLATSQIQRQITLLKTCLENWDPADSTNDDIIHNGQVVSCDRDEIEKRMELNSYNQKMDWEAREKAKGEQILIEAEKGVNSSFGRRKGEITFVVTLLSNWSMCLYI